MCLPPAEIKLSAISISNFIIPVKCNLPKASGLSNVIFALEPTNSISPHLDHLSAFPASKTGFSLLINGRKEEDEI